MSSPHAGHIRSYSAFPLRISLNIATLILTQYSLIQYSLRLAEIVLTRKSQNVQHMCVLVLCTDGITTRTTYQQYFEQ
jgi:serine/threonine protein phosphatase PrpC